MYDALTEFNVLEFHFFDTLACTNAFCPVLELTCMLFDCYFFWRPVMALTSATFLTACSGYGFHTASPTGPKPRPLPVLGAVLLNAPVLSFNDTGLSVSDGITRNGLWAVDSPGIDWEFSLDQGATWTRGVGTSFEVTGDGAKMIWVRARDDAGNRSEIVRVNCVLDTTAPSALGVAGEIKGATHSLKLSGIEPGARWEYSVDEQGTWTPGQCSALGILGNNLSRIWLRQVDLAGNASGAQAFDLQSTKPVAHEVSGNPLQPSVLTPGLQTYLIHGVVVLGDTDYVTWDIPKGQKVLSVKLVQYVSNDAFAFYALQRNKVFDADRDVSRMLVDGRMGPHDLGRNVLANVPKSQLGEGAMTLRVQQTGTQPTQYAIEVVLAPAD